MLKIHSVKSCFLKAPCILLPVNVSLVPNYLGLNPALSLTKCDPGQVISRFRICKILTIIAPTSKGCYEY